MARRAWLPDIIECVYICCTGRRSVVVVYVLTYVSVCGIFFVHVNQITYANTKTSQEKDIAKMNAVQ